MTYIPGHEHYDGYNNNKRSLVYGGSCEADHRYNPLDDGFHIDLGSTNFYIYGGNGGGYQKPNMWANLAGRLFGAVTTLGIFAMMNKSGSSSVGGTGFGSSIWGGTGSGGWGYFPGSGSSIWGGGGYADTTFSGGFNIDNTYLKPWKPILGNGTGTGNNGTGNVNGNNGTGNNGTGNVNGNNGTGNNNGNVNGNDGTGNNGTGNDNGNVNGNSGTGNDNGNGNGGKMPTATEFNNAIDDLFNGKEKLYYGHAKNTTLTNLEDTISEHEKINDTNLTDADKKKIKDGIKKGSATGKYLKEGENADTKTAEGYYKYITLTDDKSGNQYTYTFHQAKDGKLQYQLVPDLTDTTIDDNGSDKGWEKTNMKPIVTITIKDGIIYLDSSGSDYAATKKG